MAEQVQGLKPIPSWNLYGEQLAFPDVLHCEKIKDRAAGLDWVIAPHRHPHLHQFFLIRNGAVEMSVDGAYIISDSPCIITVPRAIVHGFKFGAGTDGYVVTVPIQNLPEIFEQKASMAETLSKFALVPADEELFEIFEQLQAEHEGRNSAREIMLKAQVSIIACHILRRLPFLKQTQQSGADIRFRQFEELARTHFREGWRIEKYAEKLQISSRHLGRLCQSETGQSPKEFLAAFSIQEACRLLVYTQDNIAAIGYQLGFDDPSYFSRSFRRHSGLAPKDYRTKFELK